MSLKQQRTHSTWLFSFKYNLLPTKVVKKLALIETSSAVTAVIVTSAETSETSSAVTKEIFETVETVAPKIGRSTRETVSSTK